jgi:hypothetical protein
MSTMIIEVRVQESDGTLSESERLSSGLNDADEHEEHLSDDKRSLAVSIATNRHTSAHTTPTFPLKLDAFEYIH